MNNDRVLGFDLLRGLCAFGVACYHVLGWLKVGDVKLYNVGLYGVYIFFILSGASMYIAYADRIRAGYDLRKFIVQRFFRLLPLFALVVLADPFVNHESLAGYSWGFFKAAVLNVTFAFGLANPGQTSMVTGGWSLGIEFVFYLLFPIIVAFVAGGIWSNLLLLVSIAVLQILFVSSQITGVGSLGANWITYTQFLSFSGYFVSGCVIGRMMKSASAKAESPPWQAALWIFFVALVATILLSNGTYGEAPLKGARMVLLPLVCMALVLVAGYLKFPTRTSIICAVALGNMSYGLYLLHPPVFMLLYRRADVSLLTHPVMLGAIVILVAAICALILERSLERPIIKFGKRILNKRATAPKSYPDNPLQTSLSITSTNLS